MPNSEPTAPTPNGRSAFDTVLTSTPVVLTVISTLLASQSTTEMSFAQYHRAMAAQNQSKASDQWQFFQAKRVRGTVFESSLETLGAVGSPGRVDADLLLQTADRVNAELSALERDALRLGEDISAAGASEEIKKADPAGAVAAAAKAETAAAAAAAKRLIELINAEPGKLRPEAATVFGFLNPPYPEFGGAGRFKDPAIQEAVTALRTRNLKADGRNVDTAAIENADIVKVVRAISKRRTESDTRADVEKIDVRTLVEAIKTAEADADAFDDWTRPIVDGAEGLFARVRELTGAVRTFARKVDGVRPALETAAEIETAARRVRALLRRVDGVQRSADQLMRDMTFARQSFTVWRYGVEARYNRRSAELYEIQVRKSSELSDGHMKRSWGYFYAMLTVQAAVTIATLALAVRQKSVLWGLASVATVGGAIYALAIFLNMPVPVPGV